MNEQSFTNLLHQYRSGTISPQDKRLFFRELGNYPVLLAALIDNGFQDEALELLGDEPTRELIYSAIRLGSMDAEAEPPIVPKIIHRVHFLRTAWFKYAAAIIILMGLGAYLYFSNFSNKPPVEVAKQISPAPDVQPGGHRASLTLANGITIVLDSAAIGELAREGFSKITKTANGAIEYITDRPGANMTEASSAMNTMRTPKGGEYQLILPDGSRAWLNAASSIIYPAVFVGNERKVEVTGEVYFEIAKKVRQPFRVTVNGAEVQVLGTKFNVNAYGDETALSTTLLEGSVLVKNGIAMEKLTPGQQAQISRAGDLDIIPKVKTDAVMAWKNGTISFNGHSLATNLKQLARWYDVDVVFSGKLPALELSGAISKKETLGEVLKGLALMGLHSEIQSNHRLVILEK
jgi:transmembrane sensor